MGEVHVRPEAGPWGRKMKTILKIGWYLCASILILSLPTFSFLVPPSDGAAVVRKPQGPSPRASASGAKGSGRAATRPVFSTVGASSRSNAASRLSTGASPSPGTDPSPGERPGQAGVVSAETSISPQRFQQRRLAGRVPVEPGDPEAADINNPALDNLQEGYEEAFSNLFPDVFFGVPSSTNPFQRALEEGPAGGSSTTGDDGPNPGQADESGSGDEGGESPPEAGPQPPEDPGPPEPGDNGGSDRGDGPPSRTEPNFSFLILGDIPGNPEAALISRANWDVSGQFVLENSHQFGFFTGVLHALLSFGEHESILVSDLDGNGLADVVVATEAAAVGTGIESYLQTSPGRFELHGTAFLYLQAVQSMALFDFDGDGTQELALVLYGQPNLLVYERTDSQWLYSMELALPVQPALLMTSSSVAGPRNRTLFVVDDNLQYVVSATQRRPDLFRFGSTAPLNRMSRWRINWTGRAGGESEVLAFSFADQIVLAERRGSLRTFVSMDTGRNAPLIIIGDFAGTGTRQIVWVP